MYRITHEQQKILWEREHQYPHMLKQINTEEPSSGVVRFWEFLKLKQGARSYGIEMGCGKGRNVIWLAQQAEVVMMTGFDFTYAAIEEAKRRAQRAEVKEKANFIVHDATQPSPHQADSLDFALDCFASTDIETLQGRQFAINELHRILCDGGFLMVYTLSTDDEFHKKMLKAHPAEEKNAFYHPTTGKFEKVFDRDELLDLYHGFTLVSEQRVEKTTTFFDQEYNCQHYWLVFQK